MKENSRTENDYSSDEFGMAAKLISTWTDAALDEQRDKLENGSNARIGEFLLEFLRFARLLNQFLNNQ